MNKAHVSVAATCAQENALQGRRAQRSLLLEANGLSVQKDRKTLLFDVHFQLRAGEFIAVIGANGAGKSSLMRAITGEWSSSGQIRVFGEDLGAWGRKELAKRMAVMSQQTILDFAFTAGEVVEMGRLPHTHLSRSTNLAVAHRVLRELGITQYADRILTSLSGGEAQKVQFARAITQLGDVDEPTLLILDEPTAALDLAQQKVILDASWKFSRSNNAVLAVLHDLNQVSRYADRVIVLREGRMICDAPTAQALTGPVLSEAYQVEVKVERSGDGRVIVLVE